jgi:hypothetical protein
LVELTGLAQQDPHRLGICILNADPTAKQEAQFAAIRISGDDLIKRSHKYKHHFAGRVVCYSNCYTEQLQMYLRGIIVARQISAKSNFISTTVIEDCAELLQ